MFDLIRSVFNKTEVNAEQEKRKIILNVYDMLQPGFITNVGYFLGVVKIPNPGIYHSGIEIGDHEYCFGGHDYEHVTGVFMVQPRVGPQGLLFKQSINMGNCNHFSEDLCKRLTGKQTPGWINRAAKLGTMFPCVIPTEWVEPPDATAIKSDSSRSPSSSSCSSNSPLKKPKPTASVPPPKVTKIKVKRLTSPPSSRRPSGSDSIRLVRTHVMEDDELDCSSPVKEPDTYRPDVIRSATQLSITAPVEL
ncbi:hypothetical protein [Parasitella parasitica]|uniref:PPPDE domain-containing protein n=1 Tax=Parasitella parasitica TaxID=35722 RepID=A0A0B7MU32_9FUNG|nr:hypothetical protein [Parasitella parasitica]